MGTSLTIIEQRVGAVSAVGNLAEQLRGIAPRGATPEHYLASLALYFRVHPGLMECSPESIAEGILRVAQTGLELGVSCDLLTFSNRKAGVPDVVFCPRYNGIIELALAAGTRRVVANVVREGDGFRYRDGTNFLIEHEPNHDAGARILFAYAIAELKPSAYVGVVMNREELIAHKGKFAKNPDVKAAKLDDVDWWCKKTCVRRLSPYLPKNPRLAAALMFAQTYDEKVVDEEADYEVQPILREQELPVAVSKEAPEITAPPEVQVSAALAPITRQSCITWGKKSGTAIQDLPDDYLMWGIEDGRRLGPRTNEWQTAMRAELDLRAAENAELSAEREGTESTTEDHDFDPEAWLERVQKTRAER